MRIATPDLSCAGETNALPRLLLPGVILVPALKNGRALRATTPLGNASRSGSSDPSDEQDVPIGAVSDIG